MRRRQPAHLAPQLLDSRQPVLQIMLGVEVVVVLAGALLRVTLRRLDLTQGHSDAPQLRVNRVPQHVGRAERS